MKKIIFVLILISFVVSCKKPPIDEFDYRDPYTGKFHFTTLHNVIAMCYDEPDCIDGWRVIQRDTVQYWSNVLKEGCERMKMHLWDSTDVRLGKAYHAIVPIIDQNGLLQLPEYSSATYPCFRGAYIGKDTINIYFQIGGLIGGYDKYEITGVRVW